MRVSACGLLGVFSLHPSRRRVSPLLYKEGENRANQADVRFVVRSITSAMTLHRGHATQTVVAVEWVRPATARSPATWPQGNFSPTCWRLAVRVAAARAATFASTGGDCGASVTGGCDSGGHGVLGGIAHPIEFGVTAFVTPSR